MRNIQERKRSQDYYKAETEHDPLGSWCECYYDTDMWILLTVYHYLTNKNIEQSQLPMEGVTEPIVYNRSSPGET